MRLRRRTTLLLVFAVLLLLAFGYGWHAWRSLLREQGVERLEWQGLGLSAEGIGLRRLALERRGADGASLRLDVEHALLRWPGLSGWRPRLPGLRVEQVALAWQPAAASSDDDSAALDWTSLRETLAWLPEQIHLERFHLDLPCPAGRCEQDGGLDIGRPSGALFPLAAQLRLQQEAQQAQLDAQLFEAPTGWRLRTRAQLDRQALLTLDSQLAPSDGDGLWQGRLEAPGLPDTRGLVVWLNRWLPEAQRLPDAPQALRLQADWTIRLAPGSDWLEPRRVLDGGGSAALLVQAPQAWPLPGLGNVQGELQVQLDGDEGAWLPRQLRSDLRLSQLHGEWLQALPAELRPSALGLRSEPLERDADSVTALRLAFTSEGASTLKLETRLDLLGISPWAARLVEGRLQVDAPCLQYLGWKAERLVAEIPLEGRLDGQRANLSFGRGARLQAASLAEPSTLHLGQPRLDLAGAALELAYQPLALHFAGPLQAQVGQLRQANLKPLAWTFEGPLDTTLERTSLKGRLSNGAGLAADIQLQRDAKTPLALSARLAEVFFRTGNPLAATLADWPGLLELGNGRATAAAGWKLDAAGASSLDLDLTLKGLDGIYDRSELKGLGGSLALRLRGGQLSLDSPGLSLAEANPGLPLGPVSFRGRYEAPLSAPGSGRLSWQTLQSGLFGGQASVPAGSIRLGQAEQKFALRIQGIQLGEIFRVYPAEGLAGEGALDGELPLMLNRWKPSVSGGQVKAREPGYLRFRSAKIEALGRSNPGMKLVADALDDFHYDVLQSSVDYHENGKLLLGLRLQGSNPDLEKGRPVNLNVNLEEDIPALLTSLQLSDRVSETIRQRVQERMQKRKASAP